MSTAPDTRPVEPVSAAPAGTHRLFAAGPAADHGTHLRTYGPVPESPDPSGLVRILKESGLTGRGGAAFPAWRKLEATASARGGVFAPAPVVIANGAEGEPLSFKDRVLLHNAPHLVLDGLLAVARALNASRIHLHTTAGNIAPVERAIAQRRDARGIRISEAEESFLSGEASAVVNALHTGSAVPVDRVRRLSEDGLKGRPTLVQNVETLAHIGLIARFGAQWFRSAGTPHDPGTRLVSVSGDVPAERVLEIAGGARLDDVLREAGADPASLSAVLVGGFHGRWVAPAGRRLSAADPSMQAVPPGAGILHALGAHRCGLAETARITSYLAGQSARQCGPCMFGLPALASAMARLASGEDDPTLPAELERLGLSVAGRGSCHHPDGTARLVGSALEAFAADVAHHLDGYCNRKARP